MGVARATARLGQVQDARRAFAHMLELSRQLGRPIQRDSLFVTASIEVASGDSARAVADFERVLQLDGYYEGKRTRKSRAPLLDLARITLGQGRWAEALQKARVLRQIDLVDSLAATRSADVGQADLLIARAYAGLGRVDSAAVYGRAALAALTAGAGAAHPGTHDAATLLASLAR